MEVVQLIARYLCAIIDSVIYIVISKLHSLFYEIANLYIYSDDMFKVLGQRIGLILGIFMLFRLAVSLVSYLISPDKINDKAKGGAKMITNIIISFALLATINYIFKGAYEIQNRIVESRFIEKIFFGSKASTPDLDTAYVLYSSFITPSSSLSRCEDLFDPYAELNPTCEGMLDNISNVEVQRIINDDVLKNHNLSKLLSSYDAMSHKNAGVFIFDYLPILSTIAGAAVALVFVSFSMELAKRAIKLLFLQIVAPVPIIANMDPAKGSEIFKKWYKECINTYLSLFIRIVAINFAVFMITLIKTEFHDILSGKTPLMTAVLVIGCLMFAKEVPKLLENMLGIKFDGMSLKPLKKFQEQALFGKNIVGLGAAGLAGGAAFGTNMIANKGNIFSGIAGAGSAFARGTVGAFKGQKFGQIYKGAYNGAMTARTNRDDRQELGINTFDVLGENMKKSMHIANESQKYASELKNLDEYISSGTTAKQRAEGEVDKKADMIKYNGQTLGSLRDAYEMLKNAQPDYKDSVNAVSMDEIMADPENARKAGENDEQFQARMQEIWQKRVNEHFQRSAEEMARAASEAHGKYFKARKAITNAYIENGGNLDKDSITKKDEDGNIIQNIEGFNEAFSGAYRDEIVESNINKMETLNDAHDMKQPVNRSNIGESIQHADDRRNEIKGSDAYGRAQLIQQQAAKEKK